MDKSTNYSGTQSVVRVLRLLKLFNSDQAEWSLSELVDAAGLNKTTTFRMLTALESEGLIDKTAAGNYRLGSEAIALGGRAMRGNSLRQVAHPILRQLAEETGERVTLEQLTQDAQNGYTMLVLDEVASTHLLGVNQFVGSRLPVHATSTGKAVLAHLSEAERHAILPHATVQLTSDTKTAHNGLTADLEAIRGRGYALAMGELEVGLMATAAPIFNHNGDVIAALSIVGPSVRLDETKLNALGRRAQETAGEISYQLGYRK